LTKLKFPLLSLLIVFLFVPSSYSQIRIEIDAKVKKVPKTIEISKPFMFQFEPAISFPSTKIKYKYYDFNGDIRENEYEEDYDKSLLGANLAFLPRVYSSVISSDSNSILDVRLRFTTGFWLFEHEDGWIPLEAGADFELLLLQKDGSALIPNIGFEYGLGFRIDDSDANDKMYSVRIGFAFALKTGMRLGLTYVINKVSLDREEYREEYSGTFTYNQIAFSISL